MTSQENNSTSRPEIQKNYLAWVDLEMTGLNPQTDRILEAAIIITDFTWKVYEQHEFIIYQEPEVINQMNDWCRVTHKKSGLTDKISNGLKEKVVENYFIDICKPYLSDSKIMIAGNTISQDRKFIEKWWPDYEKMLHYRSLDVSSWKIVFSNIWGLKFPKKINHRALEDIKESIEELKFYLSKANINNEKVLIS